MILQQETSKLGKNMARYFMMEIESIIGCVYNSWNHIKHNALT